MDGYLVAKIIFYGMLLAILVMPLRFTMVAYITMCSVDMPGIGNIIKIIVVPFIIYAKFINFDKKNNIQWSLFRGRKTNKHTYVIWAAFTVYVTLAILWSQTGNTVAGIKVVYNLVGICLSYLVFRKAHEHKLLNTSFLTTTVLITLALGIVQTYVLDQIYGAQFSRFTGFVASQPYAAFLVGLLALVVWNTKYTIATKFCLGTFLIIALILNSSRTWFIGASIVLILYALIRSKASSLHMSLVSTSIGIFVALLAVFYGYAMDNRENLETSNRLFQGFYALVSEDKESSGGTIGFREAMNAGMISELKNSSSSELFFGHGTSSAEYVGRKYQSYQFNGEEIDANRVAHNEWLRILYEFGILGMTIWIIFWISCIIYLIKKGTRMIPIVSYALGMIVAFTTENVLMSAGSLGICALLIILATRKPLKNPYPISNTNERYLSKTRLLT